MVAWSIPQLQPHRDFEGIPQLALLQVYSVWGLPDRKFHLASLGQRQGVGNVENSKISAILVLDLKGVFLNLFLVLGNLYSQLNEILPCPTSTKLTRVFQQSLPLSLS